MTRSLDQPIVRTLSIALAGNPNSGKTTIFNALTGLRQKVANYPGVTVEKKTGKCRLPDGRLVEIVDLPGTYSLITRSIDEHIAMEVLRGLRPDTPPPDVVIVVVDASNLDRNLYLVSQLIEVGRPMVVALNMIDIAERRGVRIDAAKLEQKLGVPVVPIVGHKRKGIANLKSQITNARIPPLPEFPLPAPMKAELLALSNALKTEFHGNGNKDRCHAIAERLLIGDSAGDMTPLTTREPFVTLLKSSQDRLQQVGIDPVQADIEAHYQWIDSVVRHAGILTEPEIHGTEHGRDARVTLDYEPVPRTLTARIDAILIHRVWGLFIFAAIMATLFVSIFFLADPLMGGIESAVNALSRLASSRLSEGPIKDLLTDGIFAGVGAVIVFIPQIALLFLFISIMEDSGYLARAAFLMDRLLSKVGLHGKSFIPLLSSFACAIPGIMATRTIESRRDRLATIFIAPFMSCSARLPVYTLLIGTFFATFSPAARGGFMLALYGLGIVAAVLTALLFKIGAKKQPAQSFILEMPSYKLPQLSQVARQVYTNSWQFLAKAGTTIFCLSVILWAMMYYPRLSPERTNAVIHEASRAAYRFRDTEHVRTEGDGRLTDEQVWKRCEEAVAAAQLRHSIAGRFGHALEPVIRPLGFDWKMGVGLVGAFAAREVFVSTMGIVYSVGDDDENTEPLAQSMLADTYPDGRKVWTPLVAVSLLVWFVIAMQCMSTLAIVKRETGGWKWPILMLVYMNALAYVVCLAVYQAGRIWWA